MSASAKKRDGFGAELTIRKGGVAATYTLAPIPLPGVLRAWRLRKVGAEQKDRPYLVTQDAEGAPLRCDCIGYQSYTRCKHARCLAKLFGLDAGVSEKVEMRQGREVPE